MPIIFMLNREVRRVPLSWKHPLDVGGHARPLLPARFADDDLTEWREAKTAWDAGQRPELWDDREPDPADYMPAFPPDVDMGICMYETTSEGTPMSSVHPDTEDGRTAMARELAARPGGGTTAGLSEDQWREIIDGEAYGMDMHTRGLV